MGNIKKLITLTLLLANTLHIANSTQNYRALNATQKEALREAVTQMFQLDSNTNIKSSEPTFDGSSRGEKKIKIPKHMLELYERYESGKIATGETIRSFEPLTDYTPFMKDILVFNMSTISGQDKIRTSQLHIFRRRLTQHQAHLKSKIRLPPCRVKLYEVVLPQGYDGDGHGAAKTKLISLDAVPLSQVSKGGWHSLEISMALKQSLNSVNSFNGPLLGVRFEGPRGRTISAAHFLKKPIDESSPAFVVVFSEGNVKNDLNITQNRFNLKPAHAIILTELLNLNEIDKTDEVENEGKTFVIDDVDSDDDYKAADKVVRHAKIPGFGDIAELTRFSLDKPVKPVRRHNHKYANTLSLRYDTAINKLIQTRQKSKRRYGQGSKHSDEQEDYEDADTDDSNSFRRRKRSFPVDSQTEFEFNLKNDNEENVVDDNTRTKYIYNLNDDEVTIQKISKDDERQKEDDLGDMIYYEPDVYMHESLIPKKYRSNHYSNNEMEIGTNEIDTDKSGTYSGDDTDLNNEELFTYKRYNNDRKALQDQEQEFKKDDRSFLGSVEQRFVHDDAHPQTSDSKKRHKSQKKKALRRERKKKRTKKQHEAPPPPNRKSSCERRELHVNFAELGLGEWVLAPETIEAGYCAGACDFPLPESSNPTTHAVIQSLVRSLNTRAGIPGVCCVPTKIAPISILYLDEAGNVVLKNDQYMVVDSCGCR